jgi:hypothetical protein
MVTERTALSKHFPVARTYQLADRRLSAVTGSGSGWQPRPWGTAGMGCHPPPSPFPAMSSQAPCTDLTALISMLRSLMAR